MKTIKFRNRRIPVAIPYIGLKTIKSINKNILNELKSQYHT